MPYVGADGTIGARKSLWTTFKEFAGCKWDESKIILRLTNRTGMEESGREFLVPIMSMEVVCCRGFCSNTQQHFSCIFIFISRTWIYSHLQSGSSFLYYDYQSKSSDHSEPCSIVGTCLFDFFTSAEHFWHKLLNLRGVFPTFFGMHTLPIANKLPNSMNDLLQLTGRSEKKRTIHLGIVIRGDPIRVVEAPIFVVWID